MYNLSKREKERDRREMESGHQDVMLGSYIHLRQRERGGGERREEREREREREREMESQDVMLGSCRLHGVCILHLSL